MTNTTRPARRRLPAEVRREAILDAAQGLYMVRGWEAVTVADVLDAAGISKGGFYHHFAAKEDLLTGIVQRTAGKTLAAGDAARRETDGDALARLNAFLSGSLRWQSENVDEMRFLVEVLTQPGNDVLVQRMFAATEEAVMPALLELIGEGAREGAFDVADVRITAEVVFNLTKGRNAALADALALASEGKLEAALARLDGRLRTEGAVCDRLLGLSPGSVLMSRLEETRQLLTGLTKSSNGTSGSRRPDPGGH